MDVNAGSRWLRAALVGWFVLAAAASVKTVIDPESHTVYTAFSHGSRDWWDGNSLYIDRAYYYSPTFAILITPFAIWPDWYGGVLWNFASVGLLAWSLRVFFRDVLAPKRGNSDSSMTTPAPLAAQQQRSSAEPHWPPEKLEAAFHFLVLFGSVRSIWSGQSNAILMALVLFAGAAIVNLRWWRAALLLAAPIYIKIWPLVIAGLLGIQWPRRLAPRLAICTVVLGLLPFLTKSPVGVVQSYREWGEGLVNRQATQFRFTGYRDAWTIWEQFQSPVNKQYYLALQVAAGLATLGWCLWQLGRGRSDRQLVALTIAAWTAWQLLFGPGTERLTYNLIAPPLAWAVLTSYRVRRGRIWITLTYLMTFVLGLGGVERSLVALVPAATAFEPIGVLMFVGWLVWDAAREWPSKRGTQEISNAPPIRRAAAAA